MIDVIQQQFEHTLATHASLYDALNAFRSWFNEHVGNYELYLEDEWYENKTVIEYILRSLDTLSSSASLAGDEYQNHRDTKGVYHLGEYQQTDWMVPSPWQTMADFFEENRPPRPKKSAQQG